MAKIKQIDADTAAAMIKDGMTVMIGGFMVNGTAETIIDALLNPELRI